MMQTWQVANQRYLMNQIAAVQSILRQHSTGGADRQAAASSSDLDREGGDWEKPPALEHLCRCFGLNLFERGIVLLCAGMELGSKWGDLCGAAGDSRHPYPTFELAQQALESPHWSAFLPSSPLRHWQLVELNSNNSLLTARLRLSERIMHELMGFPHLDNRLTKITHPLPPAARLAPSHEQRVTQMVAAWQMAAAETTFPLIQLCGIDHISKQTIATATCERLGYTLYALSSKALPPNLQDLQQFLRLWEREVVLGQVALLIDWDSAASSDPNRENRVGLLLESLKSPLILLSRDRCSALHRPFVTYTIHNPTQPEQVQLWQNHGLDESITNNGFLETLVGQFDLSLHQIASASLEAKTANASLVSPASPEESLCQQLWEACRVQARPQLDDLAQRLTPQEVWDDLILPEAPKQALQDIIAQVKQRSQVYHTWGFARKSNRGLGISALFAGVSGTGKTMAAGVVAQALQLDLYRIDLSSVVSKYIGETEKNLRRVFDAAESGGVVLLFDEADALFGKRGDVKDSHDRYANMEVSYLLQRMESYRGLAIMTTNLKDAIDPAFLRRIRFVVRFPFPDFDQRVLIWRRVFPPTLPTADLDFRKLARHNVAGGNIRNIALTAAFFAATDGCPLSMAHLLRATQSEYNKLERPTLPAEIRGWVKAAEKPKTG